MTFVSSFEKKVKKTIKDYQLAGKKDKILVACSGGKDSTVVLYLLKKFGYDAEALMIDLGIGEWSEKNLKNLRAFCRKHGIKMHVFSMRKEFGCSVCYIRSSVQFRKKLKNCMICGVIKRWLLNKKARELGAAKLATGHNLDDEAETVLMNMFRGDPVVGMGPKNGVIIDSRFVQRIKPLYFCSISESRMYSEAMKFTVLYDPCPCSITATRRWVRNWLAELENADAVKMHIVRNFLVVQKAAMKNFKSEAAIQQCSSCGEPSRGGQCRRCELISIMRE